ncbi:MAG: EamA family transporter RarD, partial [Pseudomonadota bacterium]
GAYVIWGVLPLYFKWLAHISPELMLAHRVAWSLPTGVILLLVARQFRALQKAVSPARLGWLALSSLLIGANWFVYIWAVGEGRVLEASLGYYINPLVNVAIGAVFFSERLNRVQWSAVGLAAIGVLVMTLALGHIPLVALFLCFSFAGYSLIRKQVAIDGRAGFVVEAALLFPLAGLWMLQFDAGGGAVWGTGSMSDVLSLLAAGPITAVPLILFALAAKRLSLATIGMMQYIGPTLQFALALFIFGETFGLTHAVAFGFIWAALIVFSADGLRAARTARQLAPAA